MARLRQLLREPLLHFLLIGAGLFIAYRMFNPIAASDLPSNRIVLTQADLAQMSMTWLAQGRPPPTAEQLKSLIEHRVREEILYREALSLGLDKGDTIVRRRLAQKMEFLAEDVSAIGDPSPEEIRAWFANNRDRFALAPRVTFRHLYFSPDRHGGGAREVAARTLEKLADKPRDWPEAAALADPFMFQDHYGDRSIDEVAKLFGPNFAQGLTQFVPDVWQGPIESGYGWHLVFLNTITPSRVPAFEEIERGVKTEWVAEQRAEARRKAYEAMRVRYQVVLPELPGKQAINAGVPHTTAN